MKKFLVVVFIVATSMTGVAHAQTCPTGYNYDANDGCQPISTGAETCAYGYTYDANAGCVPVETGAGTPISNGGGVQTSQSSGSSGFTALAPIPGLTEGVDATAGGLPAFFNNLYKYLIGLAAALAVIEIIWGGLQYSTQDSPGGKSGGKERIYQAIFGLVLVLSPVLVFSIINPSILNLSLNLPPLDTKSVAPVTTASETKPVLETNSQLYSCTPGTCAEVRTSCRASAFTTAPGVYYKVSAEVVCVKPGGVVDPSGRTDSWYSSFGCVADESLAVQCTISKTP